MNKNKNLTVNDIVTHIKQTLDDIDCYVNGDERRNDLMDCGYDDGSWNTLIDLLDYIGVEHNYEQV